MGLNPKGRNWGYLVNWDDLGKAYAGFIIAWTVILYSGAAWLLLNRRLPFIKIRNLPLAITSTSFLHVYLVKIVLAYTTNGNFACSAEFWIMSIYLPFGIALFQANLAQLRSISDQQKQLLSEQHTTSGSGEAAPLVHARSLWRRWNALARVKKTYVLIGVGMLTQLVITGALYATTPTLRGDWSSYGNISHAKGQAKCRKSYQWIPSAFWQLAWSWFYGPYTLYSIRNIHDVHYWRFEIILSVISGLPGSPLWLAALYSTRFKPVNKWWVPPMWLAPGIIVMQFCTIFFPIYEAYRSRHHMRTTMSLIKAWEDKRTDSYSDDHLASGATSLTSYEKSAHATSMTSSRRSRDIHSMASLEKALAINPVPLLRFAATRDFTAENIIFLMQVRRWRSAWVAASAGRPDDTVTDEARTHLFHAAVEIYVSSISDRTTEFPINIESQIRKDLDVVFEPAVPDGKYVHGGAAAFDPFSATPSPSTGAVGRPTINGRHSTSSSSGGTSATAISSSATPWDLPVPSPTKQQNSPARTADLAVSLPTSPLLIDTAAEKSQALFAPHPAVAPLGATRARIREAFDAHIFDAAEKSIKYLVLTNTWQKFVRSANSEELIREGGRGSMVIPR